MKKAVVFGGSGFVGSHVADALNNLGIEVTIFDAKEPQYAHVNQKYIKGNILDQESVKSALEGAHYIYHLAGEADISNGFNSPYKTLNLNIQGTINILEAARLFNIERFVFASTIYVFSEMGGFYKASKQSCELIIEEYSRNFDIDYTILRYGSLYGPRANDKNFIHRILKEAIYDEKIELCYGADEKRNFIHVYDAAKMSVDILDNKYKNCHVMLTGYQDITRKELIEIISEILDKNLKVNQNLLPYDRVHGHYKLTPYSFKPKLSKKIISSDYIELGQGILNCIEEIYEEKLKKHG